MIKLDCLIDKKEKKIVGRGKSVTNETTSDVEKGNMENVSGEKNEEEVVGGKEQIKKRGWRRLPREGGILPKWLNR